MGRTKQQKDEETGDDGLSTEEQMILDLTLQSPIHWLFARISGLTTDEVRSACQSIRQRLGNEV